MNRAVARVRSDMPKKISPLTRSLAVEGLELAANNYDRTHGDLKNLVMWLDEETPEAELAEAAWAVCPGGRPVRPDPNGSPVTCDSAFGSPMLAEAALLLRDGWSPGDPVETLP